MAATARIIAADCETDPFKHKRDPEPFIWGTYDGSAFRHWYSTDDFIGYIAEQKAIVYFHNGGKFDGMFLLYYVLKYSEGKPVRAQIINGRIVKVKIGKAEIRDSYAAVPEALGKIGKLDIDYAKLEANVRHLHMPEIIKYLEQDCVSLYDLMFNYRAIAGKLPTIASNALSFCKNIGIDPGKTNASFDQHFREYYFGGRTECFRPGVHRNIKMFDIRSSYPKAMCENHPNGQEWTHLTAREFHKLPKREKEKCFITLQCNVLKGCFPLRTKKGLEFPIGPGEFKVTGWEYVAADELGLFEEENILDVLRLSEEITFKPYVDHWYAYKASWDKEKNPIQYTIGKIMQNSLYGKMSQNVARYYDYIYVPGGTAIDWENGWELAAEYKSIEVHRREALWKWKNYMDKKTGKMVLNDDKTWRARPLYNNVATGASITGLARSYILRAIHDVGAKHIIYCDTDSLIVDNKAELNKLDIGPALGQWADEGLGVAGYFGGKKLYGIDLGEAKGKCTCGDPIKKTCKRHKIATKGGKLTFDQIKAVVNGEIITWKNDAPSFSIAGEASYVVRRIRSTASIPLEFN